VSYQALGEHRVTTIYSSGEQSATETEVENIEPLGTTTTLSVNYEAMAQEKIGVASGLWRIGVLTAQVNASPQATHAALDCGEGVLEQITSTGCYQAVSMVEYVYAQATGNCSAPEMGSIYISKEHPEPGESGGAGKVAGAAFSATDLEDGIYHLRASITAGDGYSASEATAQIQFKPELELAPDC
jgi:hypothetical protein